MSKPCFHVHKLCFLLNSNAQTVSPRYFLISVPVWLQAPDRFCVQNFPCWVMWFPFTQLFTSQQLKGAKDLVKRYGGVLKRTVYDRVLVVWRERQSALKYRYALARNLSSFRQSSTTLELQIAFCTWIINMFSIGTFAGELTCHWLWDRIPVLVPNSMILFSFADTLIFPSRPIWTCFMQSCLPGAFTCQDGRQSSLYSCGFTVEWRSLIK